MPNQKSSFLYTYLILLAAAVVYVGYWVPREQTVLLLSGFGVAFISFMVYLRQANEEDVDLGYYWGILLRVLLIASLPKLSDDVFRFIWDGRLLFNLEDPYKYLPAHYLNSRLTGIGPELYEKLNSKEYFSIYPPFNQVFFFLSVLFSPNSEVWSMIILRVIILVFEIGNMRLIKQLLAHYKMPQKYGFIYWLNPLVIFELTGNLHFEGIVVFFLLLALLKYEQGKLNQSAIYFGASVATKFIPLIFLPLLIRKIGLKQVVVYGAIVLATLLISFLPLINTAHIWAIWESMSLYFQKFEFNGSIYYLVRWYGFETEGHNIIAKAGLWMMYATFGSIMLYSLLAKAKGDWPKQMVWVWFFYLLFATTIHPWYVIPMLAMAVFSTKRFPLLWSGLIFLTYINYMGGDYIDRIDVVLIEYSVLLTAVLFDLFGDRLNRLFLGVTRAPF
jgi:hypothetical protein